MDCGQWQDGHQRQLSSRNKSVGWQTFLFRQILIFMTDCCEANMVYLFDIFAGFVFNGLSAGKTGKEKIFLQNIFPQT